MPGDYTWNAVPELAGVQKMKRYHPFFRLIVTVVYFFSFELGATELRDYHALSLYLAGMEVNGSSLEPQARSGAYQLHRLEMQKAWLDLEQRQLRPIQQWMSVHAQELYQSGSPLNYFFSGPDFLYAQAFFPRAKTYLLCGQEPVGDVPKIEAMSELRIQEALSQLRKSLSASLNFGFFITKDMRKDLVKTEISGTLPILLLFVARAGGRVKSVEKVYLDREGRVQLQKTSTPGLHLCFDGNYGVEQHLYYFTTDLSNGGISQNGNYMRFCRSFSSSQMMIKSASYLMHLDSFSQVREFILDQGQTLIQDDSGVPLRYFDGRQWQLNFAGQYSTPIDLFKEYTQKDLQYQYQISNVLPLKFGYGYNWKSEVTTFILAKKSHEIFSKAVPLAE
jgi:hypothetical protein